MSNQWNAPFPPQYTQPQFGQQPQYGQPQFGQQQPQYPSQPMGVPVAALSQSNGGQQQIQGGYWNPAAAPMSGGGPNEPQYFREPAYPPMFIFKQGCYYVPRSATYRFGGSNVAATTETKQLQFTKNTYILGRNASVFLADNSALPVGRTPLSCAQLKMSRSYNAGSDAIDSMEGNAIPSAECLYGNGSLPGFFMHNGLLLTAGSYLLLECRTLLDYLQVDVTIIFLEEWTMGVTV